MTKVIVIPTLISEVLGCLAQENYMKVRNLKLSQTYRTLTLV